MTAGWCVRVSVFDDLVVSISERELAGRDLSEADQELIRECAQHLLSFVGAALLPVSAALQALIVKWRTEAAAEQRVSFCADDLEAALRGIAATPPDQEPTHE